MRKVMAIGLIALAWVLVSSRSASANEFFEWLEHLSGPGPFKSIGTEASFACFGDKPVVALLCDGDRSQFKTKTFVGFQASYGRGPNNLGYPTTVPADQHDHVSVIAGLFLYDVRLSSVVDVGVAGGFRRFGGTPAGAFYKPVFDGHIAVRPWAKTDKSRGLRSIEVRGSATVLPDGFTNEDFGATSGNLTGAKEVKLTIAIVYRWWPVKRS